MSLRAERSREVETEAFIRMAIFIGGAMFGCSAGVFMICLFMGANMHRRRRRRRP